MNHRNLRIIGLAALCLSSAACASAPAKENPVIEPRTARANLQKRIDEFMANRDFVNVYMAADNVAADNSDKYIPLYNGIYLSLLSAATLSAAIYTLTKSRFAINSSMRFCKFARAVLGSITGFSFAGAEAHAAEDRHNAASPMILRFL